MPPHGKVYYSIVAVVSLFFGAAGTWGALAASGPSFLTRLVTALLGIFFLFAALQSLERLFRPENARKRSQSLSVATRRWLGVARNALAGAGFALALVSAILRWLIGGPANRDLSTNLDELSALLFFAAQCLADVCGESTPLPQRWLDFVTR